MEKKKILVGMKNFILPYEIGYEDVKCIHLVNTANETPRVHERQGISCVGERLLLSPGGLCSMELCIPCC
jgi:hypothetical protein